MESDIEGNIEERGVQNPNIVDLITFDSASNEVVLVILEERQWMNSERQFEQHDEKLNRYMVYILDGHLARQYPDYAGKPARIQLDCAGAPTPIAQQFLDNVEHICGMNGVRFVVNVTGGASKAPST
jgi:hypothetical protein